MKRLDTKEKNKPNWQKKKDIDYIKKNRKTETILEVYEKSYRENCIEVTKKKDCSGKIVFRKVQLEDCIWNTVIEKIVLRRQNLKNKNEKTV